MTDVDLLAPGPLPSPDAETTTVAVQGASPEPGAYPRPQLLRTAWATLDGAWGFAADDDDVGRSQGWAGASAFFDREIQVPYPPESEASGIGDRGFHPVVWYRRQVTEADLDAAGRGQPDSRVLLHFGAVDYRADVWLDGVHLGSHEGGHTPFSFDITDVIDLSEAPFELVVRAEDDPLDVAQPRGKQDWQATPHGVWYERTTGIWQPVWLEAVPPLHVAALTWTADLTAGTATVGLELNRRPLRQMEATVELHYGGARLAQATFVVTEPRSTHVLALPRQTNGQAYESLLWSPEHPRLIDARMTVDDDVIQSYFGLRSVGWDGGHFMLNDRPYYVRAVLAQGYWPSTHLAAADSDALRAEVQLAKDLGFNTIRMHQKFEDPRFLGWADRIGLLVWGETPSTFEFSPTAVTRLAREWLEVVQRDRSHPCIAVWVPFNESWGVQHIARDPAQLAFTRALFHLTKALDPTRLVVSNDGWEQAESDLVTVHDYGITGDEVKANWIDRATVDAVIDGIGPLGRRIQLLPAGDRQRPVIVSEFGGISYAPGHAGAGWGYATPTSSESFEHLLRELFTAVQSSPVLAGFCYTQLADTSQEVNGLADVARVPKLPLETIRSIVLGDSVQTAWQRRPKRPVEHPLPHPPAEQPG